MGYVRGGCGVGREGVVWGGRCGERGVGGEGGVGVWGGRGVGGEG